jgi:LCP family protein required for cell wall assembly
MSDWPDDWFRDPAPGADPAVQHATPEGAAPAAAVGKVTEADKLTQPRAQIAPSAGADGYTRVDGGGPAWPSQAQAGQAGGAWDGPSPAAQAGNPWGQQGQTARAGSPAAAWPEQPALRTSGGPPRSVPPGRIYGGGSGGSGWRRWLRPRRIMAIIAVLICLILVGSVVTYFYFDSQLTRKNVLVDYSGRPTPGQGTNWLITGSDSRQGLSRKAERKYHTGFDVGGGRSDTILILHVPSNGGRPVLLSLPRDSWVPIPGHGYAKINAAYSYGGPALLAKTVQNITGLYINHYMGIGFGGFVHVVNAIGGVRLCLKYPLHDKASGVDLNKGCHLLHGGEALAYVRDRHNFATQDLQRVQDQRIFLAALLRKLTSFGVLANPFKALPAASGVVGTLTVDKGTSLYQLLEVAFALRHPITTTVPIANANYLVDGQDALQWNRQLALKLFGELRNDQPISKSLITGSHEAGVS